METFVQGGAVVVIYFCFAHLPVEALIVVHSVLHRRVGWQTAPRVVTVP